MYEKKNFESLLGLEGFSDELLQNHFTLYAGYVANTNKTAELLKTLAAGTPEAAEVRRRFGWEYNGMKLHEYYFSNMSKDGGELDPSSAVAQKIERDFGSLEAWEQDFKSTGAMRGIGWVILAHDTDADRLYNVWINEHDMGHLAGSTPILVMDVFEHAFMTDYGIKRPEYIEAFWKAIDWKEVESRV